MKFGSSIAFVCLLNIFNVVPLLSFPNGAPNSSCLLVRPQHMGVPPVSGPSSITLTLSHTNYSAGDVIEVILSGGSFKGFLIVARKTTDNTQNLGTFFDLPQYARLTCTENEGRGVTHTENDVKTNVTLKWKAPVDPAGDIVFKYSVVLDNARQFYANLSSTALKAIQPSLNKFFQDPDCGRAKGCYSNCINNECDWETSWQDSGDYLKISLRSYFSLDNVYVALGFSNVSAMGPATIYSCVYYNGSINVTPGKTNGHRYTENNVSKDGISQEVNTFADGIVKCTFTVEKIGNNTNMFHLNSTWHLVTARGMAVNGTITRHSHTDRNATSYRVNLTDVTINELFVTTVTTTPTPAATPTEIGKFTKDNDCGYKKGCYSNCKDNQCDLLLAWAPKANNFEITLKTATGNSNNHYIALGLTAEDKMGDASVMACTVNQGSTVDVFLSRNTPDYSNIQLSNPKEGVLLISGSYKDGILECTFSRQTYSPNNSYFYDLSQQWHLITARGQAGSGGVLHEHEPNNRFVSEAQIDFKDVTVDISLESTKYPMIKAHGCLMVITWMLLVSIGLGFARFLKPIWPSKMPCGVKVWFAMHRAFMVLAFVCGCIGFILIFAEVQDYSKIRGEFYTKAHPILGIITTALLVINPFMSLLRCTPDNPERAFFNWAHRAVGTIAQILATITVTVGLYLPKAQVDQDVGLTIMIVYSAWHLGFFLVMSLLNDLPINIFGNFSVKSKNKGNAYTLDAVYEEAKNPEVTSKKLNSCLKQVFMFLHICVLTALTIALLYYIVEGKV